MSRLKKLSTKLVESAMGWFYGNLFPMIQIHLWAHISPGGGWTRNFNGDPILWEPCSSNQEAALALSLPPCLQLANTSPGSFGQIPSLGAAVSQSGVPACSNRSPAWRKGAQPSQTLEQATFRRLASDFSRNHSAAPHRDDDKDWFTSRGLTLGVAPADGLLRAHGRMRKILLLNLIVGLAHVTALTNSSDHYLQNEPWRLLFTQHDCGMCA